MVRFHDLALNKAAVSSAAQKLGLASSSAFLFSPLSLHLFAVTLIRARRLSKRSFLSAALLRIARMRGMRSVYNARRRKHGGGAPSPAHS